MNVLQRSSATQRVLVPAVSPPTVVRRIAPEATLRTVVGSRGVAVAVEAAATVQRRSESV